MFIIEFFTADDPAKVDDTFARFVGEFLLAPFPKEARPLRREAEMTTESTSITPTRLCDSASAASTDEMRDDGTGHDSRSYGGPGECGAGAGRVLRFARPWCFPVRCASGQHGDIGCACCLFGAERPTI